MYKQILTAASLALLLAGPAGAADDRPRGKLTTPAQSLRAKAQDQRKDFERNRDRDRDRGGHHGRDDDRGRGHGDGHDRDDDHGDWRGHDRDRHDWRGHDHGRDGRDHDRRDDDWRRRGWQYQGWRNDGWRYYRGHDHRHWRYVPPQRYGLDFGYRSGYELAWRDWLNHGRRDRYWRRTAFYGYGSGDAYRSGYDAGWRDAAMYYSRGYRPNYWSYDPTGGWYFSFSISG